MKIFRTRQSFQKWRKLKGSRKATVGFVPTMGALHEGHISLVKKSKKENDLTIVSIFVNPTQFGPSEDFSKYPRTEKEDLKLLSRERVDAVFMPKSVSEVYAKEGAEGETRLLPRPYFDQIMEGYFRPGHFEGVLRVVAKLFGIVEPTRAYFGEKDFQQLKVIEAMTEDLILPLQIVPCPIFRERSGLAMSSRNRYFDEKGRTNAARLYKILKSSSTPKEARRQLEKDGFQVQYVECWDESLKTEPKDFAGRWLAAVYFNGVRLIDNLRKTNKRQKSRLSNV